MSTFWAIAKMNPKDWDVATLDMLTGAELGALCALMGIARSGTRERQMTRLLDAADLRAILAQFERQEEMVGFFKLAELRALAARAGTYRWGNKYSIAGGLLKWRNDCRQRGKAVLEDYRAWRAEQPAQPRQIKMEVS